VRRGGRISEQRRTENRRAFAIFTLSLIAIAGIATVAFVSRAPALDEGNGCISGQLVPPAHTVVLVDQTDSLTQRQINYTKTLILLEYERLKPGERLTVRPIDEDPGSTDREFSRCRVRRGSDVLGVGANPEMIEADFRRIVGDPLNSYLDGLANVPTAEASPILETIASAVDGPDFGSNVADRRLVIVSDMAQHSEQANHYGLSAEFPVSVQARDLLRRNLAGVEVRVHYVRRANLSDVQTPAHREFWRDWLEAGGADVDLDWGLQMVDPRPDAQT
jgi:hypothetical protein